MFPYSRRVVLVALALAVSGGGCLATATVPRGHPLYPESGGRLPVNQVARLSALLPGGSSPTGGATSFIKAVDGRVVSGVDAAFELLPGCHVVETEGRLILSDMNTTWTADLGPRAFVFQMKPGYEYIVVVEMSEPSGGTARLAVFAVEQDPAGARTGVVAPVAPDVAPQACK